MAEKKQKSTRRKREKTETTVLIGSRIKSMRGNRRVSQAKLAEICDISPKYLGEVERGEANVSVELMHRIATALGVPMSSIMENTHERPYQVLISEIISLAPQLTEKDAKIVYRMIKMLTE